MLAPTRDPRRARLISRRRRPTRSPGDRPRHADGLELIGRFEGSGFKQPPYLVRRADGQVVQLSPLLYMVAEAADGIRDSTAIAAAVSPRFRRPLTPDNVRFLVERKLRPLGVMAAADGSTPKLPKRAPLLALRCRKPLVPEHAVHALGGVFKPLFMPPVVVFVALTLGLFDAWLFFSHGIAGGLRSAVYNPTILLAVFGSVIVATMFHEVGHAAACRYGGARPGAMGAGVYLVWPAFYCDVTDAYRLSRAGRLRTDLGGVYFNAIFALLAGAAYFATGHEALLLVAALQHMVIAQQMLPLLRFDGYYILSDLTGVPDILSRIGPIFRSLVPFRKTEPQVAELKPWVRLVVTLYVLAVVPMLALIVTWIVIGLPRLLATVFDSLTLHAERLADAFAAGEWSLAALGTLKILALALPVAATALTLSRVGRRTGRGVRRWAGESTARRAVALAATGALVAFLVATWWPGVQYKPIRPGERGTVGDGLGALRKGPSGRAPYAPAGQPVFGEQRTLDEAESATDGKRGKGSVDGYPQPADAEDSSRLDDDDGDWEDDPSWSEPLDTSGGATPTPTAEGTATPDATSTPAPTATADPTTSSTPTTEPTPSSTPTTQPTPSATPDATATPDPTGTADPATTSEPTATAEATATPDPTTTTESTPTPP